VTLRARVRRCMVRLYLWAACRLYDELAFLYDPVSWLVSMGRWADWRRIVLDYVHGSRVLEVGFGTGEFLLQMAGREVAVYGLEPSRAMQQVTARKLHRHRMHVPRLQGPAQALPFANGCLDTVVSTFPADFILDPATLPEIARVLRCPTPGSGEPGGRLVVVGLVVYALRLTRSSHYDLAPPREPVIEHFCAAAGAAGLMVRCISRFDGRTRLPVLIAERMS
jgi:ubiquinone/menaquinone biosynthesis C-methylase UbiE